MTQRKRNIFSINNKYQMQIVFLIVAPLFAIVTSYLVVTYFMSVQIAQLLKSQSFLLVDPSIAIWFYYTMCFTVLSLFFFTLAAFKVAYDMVNPFNRIFLEIDEFLITKVKKDIVVRPQDELAKEVADRFNKLINQMP